MVTFAENKVRQGTRGYRYDAETQNYYVRNRYYLPTLGRWLTRDPIGYQGGINLYEYAFDAPSTRLDPSGLQGWGAPPWGSMYTPPPTSIADTNLYSTGSGVAPLPNTGPNYPSGPDFGKILLGKLAGYSIGSSVGFALKNTVLELPPPLRHDCRGNGRVRKDCAVYQR